MDLNTRQLVWRTSLLLRRAEWERRRRLVREISDYHTSAERDDLFAAVERCSSPGREEVRRLLERASVRADPESCGYHRRT